MPSQKIKGTACSIHCENHRLPVLYVHMWSWYMTLRYNCHNYSAIKAAEKEIISIPLDTYIGTKNCMRS